MAVIAGLDLEDSLAPREPARDANRVQRRLGAGVGEAPLRLLEAARQLARHDHGVLDGLSEMRAPVYLLGDRVGDLRVSVADDHDAEPVVEVDVLVPIDVPHSASLGALDIEGDDLPPVLLRERALFGVAVPDLAKIGEPREAAAGKRDPRLR